MRPILLAFKGHPGRGKSALSHEVGRTRGWPVVDKNDVKDVLDGRTPEAGGLAYQLMFSVVQRHLSLGLSVVRDSPLAFEQACHVLRDTAAAADAKLLVVETRCDDPSVWRQRIERRTILSLPTHHQTTWQGLLDYLVEAATRALSDPPAAPDRGYGAPPAAVLDEIMTWIAGQTQV